MRLHASPLGLILPGQSHPLLGSSPQSMQLLLLLAGRRSSKPFFERAQGPLPAPAALSHRDLRSHSSTCESGPRKSLNVRANDRNQTMAPLPQKARPARLFLSCLLPPALREACFVSR